MCCGVYGFPAQCWVSSIGISGGMPHICMLARSLVVVPWISLRDTSHLEFIDQPLLWQRVMARETPSVQAGAPPFPPWRAVTGASRRSWSWMLKLALPLCFLPSHTWPNGSERAVSTVIVLFLSEHQFISHRHQIALLLEWTSPGAVGRSSQPHLGGDVTVNPSSQMGGAEGTPVTKGRMLCLLDLANYDCWVKLHYGPFIEETTAAPLGCRFSILNYHMIIKVWHPRLCSLKGTCEGQGCGSVVLHLSTACKPLVPSPVWLDQKEHTGPFTWNLIMYRKYTRQLRTW